MALLLFGSCNNSGKKQRSENMEENQKGSFGYDVDFLKKQGDVVILKSSDSLAQVVISPKYQAKVFTSSVDGRNGQSFGWINYKAFDGPEDPHMNGYGGEDRLWLGPEGGKYSIFFKPGDKMVFDNWHTPAGVDTESWKLESSNDKNATLSKKMSIKNYLGTDLKIYLNRQISIMENPEIEKVLGIKWSDGVKAVGFSTINTISNDGNFEWTKTTGAPCLWNLDMFSPSPETVIIIPYHEEANGKVATTDYFGEISKDRISYANGVLLFKADGKSRGKLGVPPQRAKPFAGSYDAKNKVLTIVNFDVDAKATYLNQEWTPDKNPLIGDAVNAYNDGPLEDGSQMGPFYEIESVSPAAFLKPKEKLEHKHSVFHFTGDQEKLNEISQKVLGVSLSQVSSTFK